MERKEVLKRTKGTSSVCKANNKMLVLGRVEKRYNLLFVCYLFLSWGYSLILFVLVTIVRKSKSDESLKM